MPTIEWLAHFFVFNLSPAISSDWLSCSNIFDIPSQVKEKESGPTALSILHNLSFRNLSSHMRCWFEADISVLWLYTTFLPMLNARHALIGRHMRFMIRVGDLAKLLNPFPSTVSLNRSRVFFPCYFCRLKCASRELIATRFWMSWCFFRRFWLLVIFEAGMTCILGVFMLIRRDCFEAAVKSPVSLSLARAICDLPKKKNNIGRSKWWRPWLSFVAKLYPLSKWLVENSGSIEVQFHRYRRWILPLSKQVVENSSHMSLFRWCIQHRWCE